MYDGSRQHAPFAHKFTGKERDSESGLDMFGARYYGSSLGRFMTPDWAAKPTAVPYAMFGNPQSLNLYSYVENLHGDWNSERGHVSSSHVVVLETTLRKEFGLLLRVLRLRIESLPKKVSEMQIVSY